MARQTFYFSDGPYLQAMQGLHAALSGAEAFVKFIGRPRTGKSGVCEKLTQFMRLKGYRVIYFDYPVESPEMLRTMLAKELDMPDTVNILRHLEDALAEEAEKPLIILFDDAHLLSDITLIDIYRLAGVQVQQKRVINIVLCGEPELERRLSSKQEFRSLLHHVSHNFLLEPMNVETTSHFLVAFLEIKGLSGLQLEPAAVKQFYKSCKGFPGPAYSLCERIVSIRQGSQELDTISKEELLLAIRGTESEPGHAGSKLKVGSRWMLFAPLAAVFIIASLALVVRQLNPEEPEVEATEQASFVAAVAEEVVARAAAPSPFAEDEVRATRLPPAASPAQDEDNGAAAMVVQSSSAPARAEPAQAQAASEADAPVSDSNLSLVTAQERGIADEVIAEPLFEQLGPDASASEARLQPALSVSDESVTSGDAVQLANVTLTRPMLALDDEETVIQEEAEPVFTEPTVEIAVEAVTSEPVPEQVASLVAAAEAVSLGPQQLIQHWLDAWEGKDLERYFASYDENFEPRYHNNRAAWIRNRERVIGNASQISLTMSEFELISEDTETIEVRFWLAYRSPGYKDDTRKKIILRKLPADAQGVARLVILEEINLQVRV